MRKNSVPSGCVYTVYRFSSYFKKSLIKILFNNNKKPENSTLNRDSTFNRTVCLIESTEYFHETEFEFWAIKAVLKISATFAKIFYF